MRFIADAMLGRLARWLRLLGFDTLYCPDISDSRLLRLAREQDRFILTRDTHFLNVKNFRDYLLINSNNPFEQVLEVVEALNIKEFKPGRCANCNGVLAKVRKKEDVRDMVPEHVFLNSDTFLKCQDCGNVYWEGSHLKMFREKLCDVLKGVRPQN